MQQAAGLSFFFFNDTATTEIYTLSLHDALPISECLRKLDYALRNLTILGFTNNKKLLREILNNSKFIEGDFDTSFIANNIDLKKTSDHDKLCKFAIAALLRDWNIRNSQRTIFKNLPSGWRNIYFQPQKETYTYKNEQIELYYRNTGKNKFEISIAHDKEQNTDVTESKYVVEFISLDNNILCCLINGTLQSFTIVGKNDPQNKETIHIDNSEAGSVALTKEEKIKETGDSISEGGYSAPMPGEVLKVLVKPGSVVKPGDGLIILSSMKMENTIEAQTEGTVDEIFINEKQFVEADTLLLTIK